MARKVALKKFATKRIVNPKTDPRLKSVQEKQEDKIKKDQELAVREVDPIPTSMFFKHNTALGPPYHVLVDTNFINFSVQKKLDLPSAMLDALYAIAHPCITECVIGELEKLGPKYRIALRVARDPRFKRLPCHHSGTYADDCIVQRVTQHRCYIVGTCDKALKARLRKIPGVPIMSVGGHKYTVEQLPEAYGVMY